MVLEFRFQEKVINDSLREHMEIMSKEIIKRLPDTKSVFLVGGIAKGEGGMVFLKNVVSPVNDYDIYLVLEDKASEKEITELQNICAEKIKKCVRKKYNGSPVWKEFDKIVSQIKIDIRIVTPKNISSTLSSLPLLRFYDIKHGALTVYGSDCIKNFPIIMSENMYPPDGFKLLFNECTHLLEVLEEKMFNEELSLSEKFLLNYFISKVYASICTSLLILSKSLKPSMPERVKELESIYEKEFPELYEMLPDLPEIIKEFVNSRKDCNFRSVKKDPITTFFELQKQLDTVLKYYLSKLIKMNSTETWTVISQKICKNLWKSYYSPYIDFILKKKLKFKPPGFLSIIVAFFVRSYLNLRFKRHLKSAKDKIQMSHKIKDVGTGIMSLFPLVFFSISRKGVDKELLYFAEKLFGLKVSDSWEKLRRDFIKIYISYYWQKII